MGVLKESCFLWVANHLPRIRILEPHRYRLLRLAGMDIQGPCLIWGPLSIRPIGGASHIAIGAGTFVNTDVRFGGAQGGISIGRNVQVGPRVSLRPLTTGCSTSRGAAAAIRVSRSSLKMRSGSARGQLFFRA